MKLGRRRIAIIAISIPMALVVMGYLLILYNFPETVIGYRLTATFKLNDQVSTGTGVLQVRYQPQPCFDVCGINAVLSGDAIPIDFGKEAGTLWILLRSSSTTSPKQTVHNNSPAWLVPDLFGRSEADEGRPAYARRIRTFKGTKQLTFDQLPQLLMLPNDNIPAVPWRDMPGPLRAGDLKPEFINAQIETTEDPITRGITSRLPWLIIDHNNKGALYLGGPYRDDFWR